MLEYAEGVSGYIFPMPRKRSQPVARRPRTDAQRNRERILEVAKGAFTKSGADTSLDDVAKQAGVGTGKLCTVTSRLAMP
jgi:AcrR family transcriptional regulator